MIDYTEIDIGYIDLYPNYADEEIVEEPISNYASGWEDSVQELASKVLAEYLADAGLSEDMLTQEDVEVLDATVFDRLGVYE